jgi:hypothetical protein
MALPRSRNNFAIQERIRAIEEAFSLSESVVSGDFTSRLQTVVRDVIPCLKARYQWRWTFRVSKRVTMRWTFRVSKRVTNAVDLRSKLTNIMFENPIRQLRDAVVSFNDFFFLTKRKIYLKHLVFLRSDIYERLVEQTFDRGKYYVIKVDWSDPEQLRHLLIPSLVDHDR